MKEVRIFKLGTNVQDSATGLRGQLTHYHRGDNELHYLMQPRGLNPDTGLPVKSLWIEPRRVRGGEQVVVELPTEIIGTEAEDTASGFRGTVVGITLHINGCVHATIQAKGVIKRTGDAIETCDFDIRRLKGKAIPVLAEAELQTSIKAKPSPARMPRLPFR